MDLTKKVFSNIVYLLLDWGFVTLFSFFFWFIIGKTLLPDQYGIIITTVNFISLLSGISFLGFAGALNKLIPEFYQGKQFSKIATLIRFSTKIILASNIILSLVLLFFSSMFASYMKIPLDAIYLGIPFLFFLSVSGLFGSILYGFQNMKKYFYTDILGYAAKLVIVFLFLFIGLNYFGALVSIIIGFIIISLTRLNLEWYKGKTNDLDIRMIVSDYAMSAFISVIAITILSNTQTIILSILQGVAISGIFGIAATLTLPIFSIPNILSSGLFPITSQLSSTKNSKTQQVYLISTVFRYSLFIALPLILVLVFFSDALILLFSRFEYLNASSLFLPLSFGALLFATGGLFSSSLYAIKKPKLQRNILLFISTFFLLISIPAAIYFSSIGLAYAYLITMILYTSLGFFFLRKYLSVNISFKDIFKIIGSLVGFLAVMVLTDTLQDSLVLKFLMAGIGVFVYLVLLFFLKFYRKTDIVILQYVGDKIPQVKKLTAFIIKILSKNISKD